MDTMRSLFSAAVDTGGGGESLLGSIKIAVFPIAIVFTMCFLGFLMASKFVNILPANGRKLLNGEQTDENIPMPPYFRFLALLAFKIFAVEHVDVAIMEVGLGGKYDATNVESLLAMNKLR
ncbi:hypothetical protein K1719_021595 [Acacia pycnantha]|nr:hypothetical protein K1719_021595 [Acacia pycnantha]